MSSPSRQKARRRIRFPSSLSRAANAQCCPRQQRCRLEQTNTALQREIHERERVQQALLQATQRLSGILQHAHEIIYTLDPDGRLAFVSPAATAQLGYQQEELLGRHFSTFVHPDDVQACTDFLHGILAGADTPRRIRFRVRHTSGAWRLLASTGALLPGQPDQQEAFVGIAQDITEQQRAQGLLAEREQMYRLLAEHSADVIFTTDTEGNFTYISPAVQRLTGFSQGEALRGSLYSLLHESSRPVIERAQQQRREAEQSGQREDASRAWELLLLRKDGTTVWTETMTTPLRDEHGRFEGVLGVTRDISGRKRAEQALEQAHRDMGALISAITAILVLVDPQNRITHWNESARLAFGLSERQARGLRLDQLHLNWEREQVLGMLQACRDTAQPQRLDDLHYTRQDGAEGLLGLTLYPVEGGGVLLLARDITEARTRELRQAHEQKMQSIGRLAAGVAHEINTPIQYLGFNLGFLDEAFGGFVDILQRGRTLRRSLHALGAELPPDCRIQLRELAAEEQRLDLDYLLDEAPVALANSRKGVEQITGIVQAMKQLSHPGRMAERDMGLVALNDIVRNAVTVTRNEWKRHAELELELQQDLPPVPGWGGELGQVLVNLLLNAAQAAEETAADMPRQVGRIRISTRATQDFAEVTVADSGPGVPEDSRDKIFDPFYTTKDVGKGSGQGLAIVYAIVVEQHQGSLEVGDSELGGALFTLRLPRLPEHPDDTPPATS